MGRGFRPPPSRSNRRAGLSLASSLAAFGLWPALPLTGYWLLVRRLRQSGRAPCTAIASLALAFVAGLAVWSLPMLGAVLLGVYRPALVGTLGWAVTALALLGLWRRREELAPRRPSLSGWEWVLGVGFAAAAVLYLGFPTENLAANHDEGMYVNHAISIAERGRMDIPYPFSGEAAPVLQPLMRKLPGLYATGSSMTHYLGHLFQVWLGHTYATFGAPGMYRLNAVFSLLSLGAFYGVCRFLVQKPYAVVATLFLALNVSQVWVSRITLTEVLTQLLVLSSLILLLTAFKNGDRAVARWAGILLGLCVLVRLDSFFLLPLLLLAHLTMRVVECPKQRSTHVWTALYQTAIPAFAVGVAYYPLFSRPYWNFHDEKVVLPPAILTVGALAALLLAHTRLTDLVRPLARSRGLLAVVGLVVLALSAFAYWIRPYDEPFALVSWVGPKHPIYGTRSYIEDGLVNLAKYLSPPVVWTGIGGWFVALWVAIRRQGRLYTIPALLIVAAFSALFIWNQAITPQHFWAIRRFVPVVIPGFVLFAAVGAAAVSDRLPSRWRLGVSSVALAYLAFFTAGANRLTYNFTEHDGHFEQVRRFADTLPEREPILAFGRPVWWEPLYVAFDRVVIPIKPPEGAQMRALARWIGERSRQGKPVYLLDMSQRKPVQKLPGMRYSKVRTTLMERSRVKWTPKPLPRQIIREEVRLTLYRIEPVRRRAAGRASEPSRSGAAP